MHLLSARVGRIKRTFMYQTLALHFEVSILFYLKRSDCS